ncbi:hypothetical protein ACV3OO_11860 [Clostridium perfringens]
MNRLTILQLDMYKGFPHFVKHKVWLLNKNSDAEINLYEVFTSEANNLMKKFKEIDLLTCEKEYLVDLCKQSSVLYLSFKYYRDICRKGRDCKWEEIKDIREKLRGLLDTV